MDATLALILKWHNKAPSWLRWSLFLPVSALLPTILFFPLYLIALFLGISEGLVTTIYSLIWQINFLVLIFYTVPKKPIFYLSIFTLLRAIFLVMFIVGYVMSIFNAELDFIYPREFIAEALILLCSLSLIKIYRSFKTTEKEGLSTIKYSLIFALFIIIAVCIDRALTFLSNVPYIGWFFRCIKHMRDSVIG